MKKIILLNFIVFLSAFLLFQIELMIAKILLPDYGGSYMVWGACIVFFQAALLTGYYFSHVILRRFGILRYLILHLALLLVPLLFFPGRALAPSAPANTAFLAFDVFRQLLFTIGPVFFLLATMSIVTQVWLANSKLPQKDNPYPLYAWSNLGSFAALLTYPFVFEYFFDLSTQLLIWRIGYFALIGLNVAAWFLIPASAESMRQTQLVKAPNQINFVSCFLLSAGGVMMFLAVTNIITMEIAPLPLLWIIPLSIYLLSFVLNFKRIPWYPQWIDRKIHVIIGLSTLLFFYLLQQAQATIMIGMLAVLVLLFLILMYCQNRLLNLKPKDHQELTTFYLVISFGGFVGGLLTTWIIPFVSNMLLEYLLALFMMTLTFPSPTDTIKRNSIMPLLAIVIFIAAMFVWPFIFNGYHFWGILLIVFVVLKIFSYFRNIKHATALSLMLMIMLSFYLEMAWNHNNFLYQKRNFYGIYKVYNTETLRRFRHGTTLHGSQMLDPRYQTVPTTYFGHSSPVASFLDSPDRFGIQRIGVLGLGAGTLAIYTRPGQVMDFYELDPEVYDIARRYFTFIDQAKGKINCIIGDGRLSLEKNPEVKYDLLIVDAFSGDILPYHLITKEMIKIYRQHLNPGGTILFNSSNRYLKVGRIPARIATELNAKVVYQWGTKADEVERVSLWVALTWDETVYKKLVDEFQWSTENPAVYSSLRLWTDQYSNVLPILKYDELINSLRYFRPFSW